MTELEYINKIEVATGLRITKDFGFIAGTQSPFMSQAGQQSAGKINGFTVWKKKGNDTIEKDMKNTGETTIDNIIAFLLQ